MELSIIVPVYNVESYLEKCLNSLVNQTLENDKYEIIVVNDGTKDNSQKIIDSFSSRYANVKAYIKENGGLSDARNFGIEKASGKYLAFVDSDDYVDEKMYETMLEKANEGNFDMVVCDFIEVYEDRQVKCSSHLDHDVLDLLKEKKVMCNFYPSAWNKLYRKELFDKIRFKKGVWFEDVECIHRLLPLVHSIGSVQQPFYYYIQRQGSISKSTDERIFHCVDNWNGIMEYYEANPTYLEQYKDELEFCYVRYLYATFLKASLKYDHITYRRAVETAIKNVKEHFPKYRKNKYCYQSVKGLYLVMFNRLIAEFLYLLKGRKG